MQAFTLEYDPIQWEELFNVLIRKICVRGVAAVLLLYAPLAAAYIGPGLGVGVIVTVLGAVIGVLLLLVGIIWYPFKRLMRRIWLRR